MLLEVVASAMVDDSKEAITAIRSLLLFNSFLIPLHTSLSTTAFGTDTAAAGGVSTLPQYDLRNLQQISRIIANISRHGM